MPLTFNDAEAIVLLDGNHSNQDNDTAIKAKTHTFVDGEVTAHKERTYILCSDMTTLDAHFDDHYRFRTGPDTHVEVDQDHVVEMVDLSEARYRLLKLRNQMFE